MKRTAGSLGADAQAPFDVAAYIWPSYTGDEPRSLQFWPEGYGEWQTVKAATAKYEGHQWPRRPLWGYCNEADPRVMEMQIDAAADHGVNVFIYDWYGYLEAVRKVFCDEKGSDRIGTKEQAQCEVSCP